MMSYDQFATLEVAHERLETRRSFRTLVDPLPLLAAPFT